MYELLYGLQAACTPLYGLYACTRKPGQKRQFRRNAAGIRGVCGFGQPAALLELLSDFLHLVVADPLPCKGLRQAVDDEPAIQVLQGIAHQNFLKRVEWVDIHRLLQGGTRLLRLEVIGLEDAKTIV